MTFEELIRETRVALAYDPDKRLWTSDELLEFFKWAEKDIRKWKTRRRSTKTLKTK